MTITKIVCIKSNPEEILEVCTNVPTLHTIHVYKQIFRFYAAIFILYYTYFLV